MVFCFVEFSFILSIVFSIVNKASKISTVTSDWSKKFRNFSKDELASFKVTRGRRLVSSSSTLNIFSKISASERTPIQQHLHPYWRNQWIIHFLELAGNSIVFVFCFLNFCGKSRFFKTVVYCKWSHFFPCLINKYYSN